MNPLTYVLQKWMQEGLFFWFHSTISIPTSQGDKVLWYQTLILFLFFSTKCSHVTEADMFVLWDTKRLNNPIDALFLGIWKAFKCLLQNTVLSCLFDLKLCKKNSFLMMWFSNGQGLDDLIQFVRVLTRFLMLLQVKFYHYETGSSNRKRCWQALEDISLKAKLLPARSSL